MKKDYEGPCAGGPLNGKSLAARTKTVCVPIRMPDGFGRGSYVFNPDVRMWIWSGAWPIAAAA